MTFTLPKISKLVYQNNGNEIWQYFGIESSINDVQISSINPFIVESNDIKYVLTSDKTFQDDAFEYILLTSRRPSRSDFSSGRIKIKRWLKHPHFQNKTPKEIVSTWSDKFKFVKENEQENIKGLRPPQIGALYSILAHIQNPEDKAIVVMPTGTGKTETMLATLISNSCERLLVSVPSDALRTQISDKFITLGLLKEYRIVDSTCMNPIVGIINAGFNTIQELQEFVEKCNVVVSTMDLLVDFSAPERTLLNSLFSQFFVDEAHHSEARTWKELIEKFDKQKVFLFTATPFRNDGKSLQGKIIFNFSLRKAQEQKYYKKINYLPIREYNKNLADKRIAENAVMQLKTDIASGYNHFIMARCMNKNRAIEVFEYYKEYPEHNPVMVYTGIAGLKNKIEAIKRGEHSIIICVNMLGEGFDLPNLKIAAIHDERQSLPITLQFIGRFTRTSYSELGSASFIANTAYPPINEELDQLYARNSDWNLLLPRLSANATQKELDIKSFLDKFNNLSESIVPFQEINPAMSTVIFRCGVTTWNPSIWESGFPNIASYEHVFSRHSQDTLIIILGKIEKVEWGKFETAQNLQWDLVVIHWDLRPGINRVFLNTSIRGFSGVSLMDAIFKERNTDLITGMNVFRIFHNVNRLSLYNVGTRKSIGQDITFQAYFGKGVQDGIKLLEQGTLIKNNIFGVGYKDGEKVSLGCSVKGKIWSYQRGNLDELTKWCKTIGDVVANDEIDTNVVLQHTLAIEKLQQRPNVMPILIDWNPEMYENSESRYQIIINGVLYDLSNTELNLVNASIDQSIRFSVDTNDCSVQFEIEIGINPVTNENYYKLIQLTNENCTIQYGNTNEPLLFFFQNVTPTIWFADGSQLFGNLFVRLKVQPDVISMNNIITDNWSGVSIRKESQDISPYIQDSIQFYFIEKIRNDFQVIYDDDGKGEIADIIGINDSETVIDIHLYHLKYAKNGEISNDIDNFYQVCGQAEKSLKWKHKSGREFFTHLFRRKTKILNGNSCSRIIKGTEDDIENLLEQAKWTKAMRFHIYVVQPALSKANASDDILLLLGNVHHYLSTVGNIELKVYSSQ
ncbi:MAG: DNA/RNA helicase [Bacteroidetes bacterium GWF2_42_66]|nr:MAG: DNA/RNA helicase [Bacteroidetes bacterium GWA2_42_15]OFX98921.1 MAG: DNA/RNA helicase [Bacteroidetes bacterium GWE2_42_39]OFY45719.1 MAG: DNA/RNA helicase [Bacteroidetes bacterium GWF2_42_66]HBL77397.1 DNA/RNA helicase [Prolixibacteraceae bacterium]HCU62439.1 DNA/RNA helicase [Prolixibacteraceae bacterium]